MQSLEPFYLYSCYFFIIQRFNFLDQQYDDTGILWWVGQGCDWSWSLTRETSGMALCVFCDGLSVAYLVIHMFLYSADKV